MLFSHLVPRTPRGYTVVVDQETHFATMFEPWFSGYEDSREVQRQISYGYVEQAGAAAPAPPPRAIRYPTTSVRFER